MIARLAIGVAAVVVALWVWTFAHAQSVDPGGAAQMRITDRLEQVEADQAALNSAAATGQHIHDLLADCITDTTAYNQAAEEARYVPAGMPDHLNPQLECKATP